MKNTYTQISYMLLLKRTKYILFDKYVYFGSMFGLVVLLCTLSSPVNGQTQLKFEGKDGSTYIYEGPEAMPISIQKQLRTKIDGNLDRIIPNIETRSSGGKNSVNVWSTYAVSSEVNALVACQLIVDCSNIFDQELACRGDLPDVDKDLPIILDSCGDISIGSFTIVPGNTGCPGEEVTISRTYYINDGVNPEVQCMQTFTVISRLGPSFSSFPSDVVIRPGDDTSPANTGTAVGIAECGTPLVTFSDNVIPGSCPQEMTFNRTWTVTDPCGRSVDQNQLIMIEDNTPPTIECKSITVELDENGMATITPADIDNGSSDDNGGVVTLSLDKELFTCDNLGGNNVLLTGEDECGNSSFCLAYVTVFDNLPPTLEAHNVILILDENGYASVDVDDVDNGSSDNCTIVNKWLVGQTEYDCGDVGEHFVDLYVQDQSGNISSQRAAVIVKFYVPDLEKLTDVSDGDTVHQVNCQAPREMALSAKELDILKQYGTIRSSVYKVGVPENAPWGMYSLWETMVDWTDVCFHTYRYSFYQALYDLEPPIFQYFPEDIVVSSVEDLPGVDQDVKILDVCQYVVWDTVVMIPIVDNATGDTLGYTYRWIAMDASGHRSFRDQYIWLEEKDRSEFGRITGRIGDEASILAARYEGEAGTNGLPVKLYRLDEVSGERTQVGSWTTGDWNGEQGKYFFELLSPGKYQVKIDTAICLVDTLKFDKFLWSDTLEVLAGQTIDQGWIISGGCVKTEADNDDVEFTEFLIQADRIRKNLPLSQKWVVYPNPTEGQLRIELNVEGELKYRIFGLLGQLIQEGEYINGGNIDLHEVQSGAYFMQLWQAEEYMGVKRFTIIK